MSENLIPFHVNNGVQKIAAEGLEGEFQLELHCLSGGPVFLLRPDASGNTAQAAASVAAGSNVDFVLAAAVGNPVKRKVTDTNWVIYSAGDCVGLLIATDDLR